MRRRKNKNKLIVISTLTLLLFISAGYAAFSTNLSFNAKGNVKEKSRVIQSWSSTDVTDFHSAFYKENIVSVTFLNSADVPINATESFNVSEDKTHGGVMAYVIPNQNDSTKYDLYIGAREGVIANTDSSSLFNGFINVKTINFNNNFDTSNATNIGGMFTNCRELTSLDLSCFDTERVTNMNGLFLSTKTDAPMKIENIKFGDKFNTHNVTNMSGMFGNCSYLKELDLSSFDTSNVTNMLDMFSSCSRLTKLDVSNFNTENVIYMRGMFFGCGSLTTLNLCSFNTSNVTNMSLLFTNTSNMTKIYVGPNWNVGNADTSSMFIGSGVSSVTTGEC